MTTDQKYRLIELIRESRQNVRDYLYMACMDLESDLPLSALDRFDKMKLVVDSLKAQAREMIEESREESEVVASLDPAAPVAEWLDYPYPVDTTPAQKKEVG